VKADQGTYGMAVMMIKDPEELMTLNRKQRTKMSSLKGGNAVTKVIMQEGIYTFETVGDEMAVAEPVVYHIGRHVVGGFYRIHKNRGIDENLNAAGMDFHPLAFARNCHVPPHAQCAPEDSVNRFYAYGVVGRLAMLAAARELA
jgi:glutamate--cysteine ligase